MPVNKTTHWANIEEVGVYWLMKFMFALYNIAGRTIFLVVLYPVVSYYFLTNKKARSASMDFLQHVESFSQTIKHNPHVKRIRATHWNSYLHFMQFAESMVDKLSAWNNRINTDDVIIHGREEIEALLGRKQGGMILGSHLGNIEVCRALATIGQHAKLNILVHTKHAENFNRLLSDVSTAQTVELIQVTDVGPSLAISLDEKIQAGEFVFIVGDRIPLKNTARTLSTPFMGENAYFAQGPFILASLMKCPVYTLFCIKQEGVFNLYFEDFSKRIILPRKSREAALEQYVQQFSQRLQHYCLLEPLQWFNFYHYWQTPEQQEQHK